jgi:hypothetical protein
MMQSSAIVTGNDREQVRTVIQLIHQSEMFKNGSKKIPAVCSPNTALPTPTVVERKETPATSISDTGIDNKETLYLTIDTKYFRADVELVNYF